MSLQLFLLKRRLRGDYFLVIFIKENDGISKETLFWGQGNGRVPKEEIILKLSLKRRRMTFVKKERWHPAATFLSSECAHSLWRKKPELHPISSQWFLKEDNGLWPGMGGIFDGSFTYLGWNLTKRLLTSPLTCVLRKPGSAFEPLSVSYRSSLASWTQWLKLFFSVIYTMVGTKSKGTSKKCVTVEKQR